jgi:hypothetical protein
VLLLGSSGTLTPTDRRSAGLTRVGVWVDAGTARKLASLRLLYGSTKAAIVAAIDREFTESSDRMEGLCRKRESS